MKNKSIWGVSFIVLFFGVLFLVQVHAEVYEASDTPWSGYWWPFNSCGLATGSGYYEDPSPLEKYEQYTLGYYPGVLTNWYEETYCEQDWESWNGHCGHWALAASSENYDILPSVLDNIVFRVGDKKGLLTLCHNSDEATWGSAANAENFHYWLLQYIGDAQRAFVADMDGTEEVWQYPLYKYDMTSTVSGNVESVEVTVYGASDLVDPDYIGTKEVSWTLTYDLYLNGDGDIIDGEWTGDCADGDRPQKLYYFLAQGSTASGLDYDTVVKIAQSVDDEYENGDDSAELPPGTHNLILLDTDLYELTAQAGDVLTFDISIIEGGGDDLTAVLTDNDGTVINTLSVTSDDSKSLEISAANPPYYLEIYKSDYQTPGIYTLTYDLFRNESFTCFYLPTNGDWSGFSIINPGEDALTNVTLVSYTEEGSPLQTLMGPVDMAAGEKRLFLFSSLPYYQHELSKVDSLRISADSELGAVNLIGNGSAVAAEAHSRYQGVHLVLPDSVAEMQSGSQMFGSIINESLFDADITLTLYNSDGGIQKTVTSTLAAREAYGFRSGRSPFYTVPEGGWFDISTDSDNAVLSGYQYISRNGEVEMNPAVPVSDSTKIVPHIPNSANWSTSLVLINTTSQTASVVLHRIMAGTDTTTDVSLSLEAKQRKELSLETYFGTTAGDKYYRSILSISSDQELSGYYSYKASGRDDNVNIPLMESDDFSPSQLLSHNTQSNAWMTGIGLVNPNSDTVQIAIKPYGGDGELLSNLVETVSLSSGQYNIYNLEKIFGDAVHDITFIRFEEENSRPIGGFYLFDNSEEGVCGANFQALD